MAEKSIKSFNIEDSIFRWMQIWQEDSGWNMSKVLEFALLKHIPSRLIQTKTGWDFLKIKTTLDLGSDEDQN